MGKVAIVGVEGSGKTVLMGALCECYKQGTEDEPYLMPENQAAFMFMERIPHKLRVEREWPEATSVSSLKAMRWTLRLGGEVLEEIEMLDYPGELYRIAFGERTKEEADAHRTELNEFLEHLTEADTLIVLLNIADTMNLGANPRHAETVWITRGIFDLAKNKLPNIKRKSLVFSQADRFQTMLEVQGGAQGVYAKQLPMMKKLYPDLNVIAVSAVSATDGEGRPKAGYSADGCRELMREILWEEGKALQAVLEACDRLRQTIRDAEDQADRGVSPATYMRLLDDYLSKAEEIRPFPHSTGNKAETRKVGTCLSRAGRYAELRKAIEKCDRQPKKVLATREGWRRVIEEFDGCDELIDGFVEHYRNEVKSDRLLTVVVGVVIASMYVFFMSVSACENKARQAAEQRAREEKELQEMRGPPEGQPWTSPATGMAFVWVPALKVWAGKYEVTNGEYRKKEPGHDSKEYKGQSLNGERQPAVYVNFDDAKAYAAWLTERDKGQLGGLRYRVISEKEWETVAQCGDGREYPWGNAMPPKYGNYCGQETKGIAGSMIDNWRDDYAVTCPVEKSGANEWGLYGIGGNVWECCASDNSGGSFGAWRGASWLNIYPDFLRVAFRFVFDVSVRDYIFGFRLALSR